ncbi:hypothetical protein DID80_00095 [Candidatus Marinamargulisbacteria bacterium SCGC AAA071-K20]|nr:hypothetical protein DID80_00095 [Candidatus Marinamargulisbacteria bacterium SCGC AAA071-K20]
MEVLGAVNLGSVYKQDGGLTQRCSARQMDEGYHRLDTAEEQISGADGITYQEARGLKSSTTEETLIDNSLKLAKVLTECRRTANFVEGTAVSATDKLGDHAEYAIKYAKAFLEGHIKTSTLFGINTTKGDVDAQLAECRAYQDLDADDSSDEDYDVQNDKSDDEYDDDVYNNSIRDSLSIKNLALGTISAAFSGAIYLASSKATTVYSVASLGVLAINAGTSIVTERPMTRPAGILAHNIVGFAATRLAMIFCPAPVAVGVSVITSAYSFYKNVAEPVIADHREEKDELSDTIQEAGEPLSPRFEARRAEIQEGIIQISIKN